MRETLYIKKIVILFLLAVLPFAGYSQVRGTASGSAGPRVLTGTVRNSSGPMSAVGVSVLNENNRVIAGNHSQANGEFYVRIPATSDKLKVEFSFLGYRTHTVEYTGQPTISVTMEQDPMAIRKVTVTDRAVRKSEMGIPVDVMGSARQKVDMADLEGIPATSVTDALYGALTGVDIVTTSGDPGAKSSIRIRGTGSLNGSNEPLFVVDGIPYEPPALSEDFNYASADENDFGALLNITPSDIESIEVLMDAMAVMAWGSKGANGVLLITTKTGTSGPTRFQINERFDYNFEARTIPLLNGPQYVTLIQDAMWNRMGDVGYTNSEMRILSSAPEINFDPEYVYFQEYSANTDWLNEVKQTAYTNDIAFTMNGGGERAKYTFSLTNTLGPGTTQGTDFTRLTARLKVNYTFSKKLRVSSSLDYAQNKRDDVMPFNDGSNITGDNARNPRAIAEIKMPNMSPYRIDDNGNRTSEYFVPVATSTYTPFQGIFSNSGSMMYNPVAMVKEASNKLTGQTINVVFRMEYDIIENLQYVADVSLRLTSNNRRTFLPAIATGVSSSNPLYNVASEMKEDDMAMYVNNQLQYSYFFDQEKKTAFYVTQRFNIDQSSGNDYDSNTKGLADVSMSDPVSGGLVGILKSSTSESRAVNSTTSANYTYKERYSVTGGLTIGGSTKLGPEARWKVYPTVSGVWHFSKENFMRGQSWLNDGKFSASWGRSGRLPSSNFSYIGRFNSAGQYIGEPAVAPGSIQADKLKAEINRQTNIQVEMSFLKNFFVKVAYYDKKDSDQLQQNAPVPWATGFSTISWFNSGASGNRGVDVEFNFKDILRHKDWKLTGGVNFSLNRNRVIELPVNKTFDSYTFGNGNYARNVTIGNPIGSLYGYRYEGVYQTYDDIIARDAKGNKINDFMGNPVETTINGVALHPGDAKYEDVNHDGVIDKYDIVYLGNSQPLFFTGQNASLRWKNLQLDLRGYLYVGNKIINRARINTENMYDSNNQSTAVLRRWRREGDDTDIPRALWRRGYNYLGSDRFVDDGTYFRLKQLTLTYYLSERVAKKIGLTPGNTRVYMTAYDLLTFTKYSGQNPEVGRGSGMHPVSEDNSKTPRPVKLTFGFSVDF